MDADSFAQIIDHNWKWQRTKHNALRDPAKHFHWHWSFPICYHTLGSELKKNLSIHKPFLGQQHYVVLLTVAILDSTMSKALAKMSINHINIWSHKMQKLFHHNFRVVGSSCSSSIEKFQVFTDAPESTVVSELQRPNGFSTLWVLTP